MLHVDDLIEPGPDRSPFAPSDAARFVIGLMLLKHIFGLVCERWIYDPYFQYFTGEEFFQDHFPHERSDLSHWRKWLGSKLELPLAESLRVAHEARALRTKHSRHHRAAQGHHSDRRQAAARRDQGSQPVCQEARRAAAAALCAWPSAPP